MRWLVCFKHNSHSSLFLSLFQDLPPVSRALYVPGAVLLIGYPALVVLLGNYVFWELEQVTGVQGIFMLGLCAALADGSATTMCVAAPRTALSRIAEISMPPPSSNPGR